MGKPNRRAKHSTRNRSRRQPFRRRPPAPAPPPSIPTVPVSEDPLAPWSRLGPLPWLSGTDLMRLYCLMESWLGDHADPALEDLVWDTLSDDLSLDEHTGLVTTQHLDHWLLAASAQSPDGLPSAYACMAEVAKVEGHAAVAVALMAMDRSVLARFEVVATPAPGVVRVRHLHREGASTTTALVELPFTFGRVPLGAGLVGRVWPGEAGGLRFGPDLLVFPSPPDLHRYHPEADGAMWLQLWYQCGCRGEDFERRHPPLPPGIELSPQPDRLH